MTGDKKLPEEGTDRTGRVVYLDYLRVLATVLVVAAHSLSYSVELLSEDSSLKILLSVLGSFCLSCNVMFIMLSGAAVLGLSGKPPESFGEVYRKRLLRVLVPGAAYYLFYCYYYFGLAYLRPTNWGQVLRQFLANSSGVTPHFWFVLAIASVYLSAPLWLVMLPHMSDRMLDGMAATILVLHMVYTYGPVFGFSVTPVAIPVLSVWESVFLLGYYVTTEAAMKNYRLVLAGGAASAVFIVFAVARISEYDALIYNNAPPTLLFVMAVFLFFRKYSSKLFSKSHRLVSFISKYSYSILLIHWFIMFEFVGARLGIHGLRFRVWGGTPLCVLLTLVFSSLFAVFYDNTVVFFLNLAVCGLVNRVFGKS